MVQRSGVNEFGRMSREEYNERNTLLDNYLITESDVGAAATKNAADKGITVESAGSQENYDNVLRNFAVAHIIQKGMNEQRGSLNNEDGTARFASDPSGRNTKLTVIGGVQAGQPVLDYVNIMPGSGARIIHYGPAPGSEGLDADTPTIGSIPDLPADGSGGGGSGGGGSGDGGSGDGGGSDNNASEDSGFPSGGGGIMSGPVDLDPVTNLIGTPGAGQTGTQATLMGQTAGLATDIAGVRGVVNPIGEQVTALQSAVTPLAGNVGEIKTGVTNLETNVGTAADKSGLYAPISNLQTGVTGLSTAIGTQADGQPNLLTGQKDLTTDVGNVQTGVTNLTTNMGAPTVGGPQTLFEGQGLMQDRIGQEAVKNPDGVVTTPATGLFEGQSGLMTGQTGLTRGIEGLGTQLGDSQRTLEGQIGRFQTAAEQYQRGATTQRGSIEGNQISNQQAMLNQVQGVGQPLNRQADMLATQRAQEAASFAASQAPLQSQIATLTANNANQAANNQPIGPLGPMAADPRDALIQQLLTRNASLMNNRPV
tara:strand:- start:2292 stop:3905 length:1614 start_codon:yes stop_codon:yes gene_type:complete